MRNRKKLVYLGFALVFLLFVFARPTVSQNTSNFRQAFSTYQDTLEDYQEKHGEYVLKRAQYLRFGTQKSQTDAKEATVAMLQARDRVIIDYLRALKARLEETPGVSDERLTNFQNRIDEEIAWFTDHRNRLTSAGTLDDLVEDSDEARDRHETTTEVLFYELLSHLGLAKVNDLQTRMETTTSLLEDKVDEIRNDEREGYSFSNSKMQVIDRWLLETNNLLIRSDEKQKEALDLISEMIETRRRNTLVSDYNDVIIKLGESRQFLNEASSFLQELIRELKTAEE